jgi:phage shock protein A
MAAPAPIACSEKRRLIMRFTAAIAECNSLQEKQIAALLRGDGFLLETLIEEALERRNQTKYAVIEHQRQHGC